MNIQFSPQIRSTFDANFAKMGARLLIINKLVVIRKCLSDEVDNSLNSLIIQYCTYSRILVSWPTLVTNGSNQNRLKNYSDCSVRLYSTPKKLLTDDEKYNMTWLWLLLSLQTVNTRLIFIQFLPIFHTFSYFSFDALEIKSLS